MVSPTAGDKGVRGSHSVWRYYLKQFSPDGKCIYAKNIKTGKSHKISIASATVCNDIYRMEEKISPLDVLFFKALASAKGPLDDIDNKIIDELVGFINNDPRPFIQSPEHQALLFQELIAKYIDKDALLRNQEELFTFYEENFIALYEKLLKKDASFFNTLYEDKHMLTGYMAAIAFKTSNFLHTKFIDLLCRAMSESKAPESWINEIRQGHKAGFRQLEALLAEKFPYSSEKYFASYYLICFLFSQNLRTQKYYFNLSSLEDKIPQEFSMYKGKFNYKNIAYLFIHFQTYRMGISLIEDKFKILLLNNGTEVKFLTSDQPIFNIHAALSPGQLLFGEEFELYYPLRPDLAMLFTNKPCYNNIDMIDISADSVVEYNKLTEKICLNMVYSHDSFT